MVAGLAVLSSIFPLVTFAIRTHPACVERSRQHHEPRASAKVQREERPECQHPFTSPNPWKRPFSTD
jgi:hypothetical protein